MSIEEIKKEIKYYTGKKSVSDVEAEEILYFYESNGCKELDAVINDYYSCC